jgi:hypothetical protein
VAPVVYLLLSEYATCNIYFFVVASHLHVNKTEPQTQSTISSKYQIIFTVAFGDIYSLILIIWIIEWGGTSRYPRDITSISKENLNFILMI